MQAQDQRSVHQDMHQHAYDQRSMQVQIGMDPVAIIQYIQGVKRLAHVAIHEVRSEVTSTQRLADQGVQNIVQEARTHVSEVQAQAQVQVQSVETRAQAIVSDMETNYQKEIAQIQDIDQRTYEDSQHRLSQMEDRNRELLAIIESQSQALESQRDEQRNLMNQVGSLQSEITMLRHSSAQYDVPIRDQNGTVDVSGLMQMMNSLKDEIKILRGKHPSKKKHESHVDSRVAVPPEPAQSACARYPPSQEPSPAHSMHSRHSKEPQKPNAAPQMFSLSTYSYLGNASTIELPGSSTQKGLDPPPDNSSSSSSSTSDRHGGGGGSPDRGRGSPPNDSPASSGLGRVRGDRINPSIGVGSAVIFDESVIYKAKDLSLIKIETIPVDAAQYRGWKNAFLTKASSIDKTGQSQILQWLLQAFSPDVTREMLILTSAEMPRLDAHLASVLMEAKHLKGELGLQFQAYTESEQMRGRAPLGRMLLNMIARRLTFAFAALCINRQSCCRDHSFGWKSCIIECVFRCIQRVNIFHGKIIDWKVHAVRCHLCINAQWCPYAAGVCLRGNTVGSTSRCPSP